MDRHGRALVRLLVGAYVIYLAVRLVTTQLSGAGDMSNTLAYLFAGLLFAGGLAVCIYSIREYIKEKKADEAVENADSDNA